jgi:hypothetical protein
MDIGFGKSGQAAARRMSRRDHPLGAIDDRGQAFDLDQGVGIGQGPDRLGGAIALAEDPPGCEPAATTGRRFKGLGWRKL